MACPSMHYVVIAFPISVQIALVQQLQKASGSLARLRHLFVKLNGGKIIFAGSLFSPAASD